MRKALKNVPQPDKDKLAIFYGKPEVPTTKSDQSPTVATVDNLSTTTETPTVDKSATVESLPTDPKMTTVDNSEPVRNKIKTLLTPSQQVVYMTLFNRSHSLNRELTDWIGYSELSNEVNVSYKTIQRLIKNIADMGLIKKVDFANSQEHKGSKYKVFVPQ